jgi:hypothetical protein
MNYFLRLALNLDPPISASQVAGIIGMNPQPLALYSSNCLYDDLEYVLC